MMRMYSKVIALLLLVITGLGSMQVAAFPEIPFCPLGGPPGWANRLFDLDDDYYPPPRYYGAPYWQGYPQYSPAYPVDPSFQWYPAPTGRGW